MIKSLQAMTTTELETSSSELAKAIADCELKIAAFQVQLKSINEEIQFRKRPTIEPRLSDHALIRYIERRIGIDVEAYRKEIMTDTVLAAVRAGASSITVNDVKMVVKDNTIVTVMVPEPKKKRRARDMKQFEPELDS